MDSIYKGILKKWNEDKWFGFISPENGSKDVYNLNSSNELTKENRLSVVVSSPVIFTPVTPVNYKCDGREHCSQMNSRDEAKFFIRNCPNTKMDGDNDGIPCENDSRF